MALYSLEPYWSEKHLPHALDRIWFIANFKIVWYRSEKGKKHSLLFKIKQHPKQHQNAENLPCNLERSMRQWLRVFMSLLLSACAGASTNPDQLFHILRHQRSSHRHHNKTAREGQRALRNDRATAACIGFIKKR